MRSAPDGAGRPGQAWSHRSGKVDLRPLAPGDWSPEALTARAQIAEAFSRFGTAFDEARVDVLCSCFTDDALFEVGLGSAEPRTRFGSRQEIAEQLPGRIAAQADQRRHLMGNVLVEQLDLEAGTAKALAYSVVTVASDGLSLGASVIYTSELRREDDGCWRFSSFFIGMDEYLPTSRQDGSA
ncbi:SnoaL-like domain-containing protein [Geodermatophilus amargosae]|uniref:SnoaL-like domain-containing protein n=1 Tax=Geodermatophilus amargosae TaxID=1296565 RepID=A0A1I7D242_9ACTN|nr:nuclear transport factor 2 family protein [Geodermatophilus amargosae]SFU05739.1 SnoaL-like domain-containing protein [Geodermatophilus amargosae]